MLSKVFRAIEKSGYGLIDLYSLMMNEDDVYNYSEVSGVFIDREELASYIGRCVVILIETNTDKKKYNLRVPGVTLTPANEAIASYWFGKLC